MEHLGKDATENLILIAEDLYEDLCKAIEDIRQLPPDQRRDLNGPFLNVPEDNRHMYQGTSGANTNFT